ncbi:OsmC family protein [Xanthobacter sp. TB0136]|uniref:OsmC family protein n=1 Tax=Xanthobacter sp. TB0136 TaxID=3459177 RepID=UPI00403A5D1F
MPALHKPKDFHATVRWWRGAVPFTDGLYPRGHVWVFDEGVEVPASAAPACMPQPLSRPDAVDPEEALVAAASSCHMLFALDFARRAGFRVDSYEDAATGVLSPNGQGRLFMSRITLRPVMVFSGEKIPSEEDLARLHHQAHDACYVAHSLRAEITVSACMHVA